MKDYPFLCEIYYVDLKELQNNIAVETRVVGFAMFKFYVLSH